jgi:addiction module RelE/StbE family toxin
MSIEWSGPALDDLEEIVAYLRQDDPATAQTISDRIFQASERLLNFPGSGRPGKHEGTRELLVPGLPYILVYVMRGSGVRIARIMHTSREWP